MAWPNPFGNWPPTAGDKHLIQYYARFEQIQEAIRERVAALNNSAVWPFGSSTWAQGAVAQIQLSTTPGRMTISVADAVDWIDGSNIKRWVNFSGIFNGSDLRPYAPGFYKVVLYQPDAYNHDFGNPNRGLVYDIIDNDHATLDVLDDGQLTLNGLTLANYQGTGWRYQIIRSGSGTQRGFGWVERFPPKPNHPELDYGQITAATTTTLSDTRTGASGGWRTPKRWTANQWAGKELIVQIGTEWKRLAIASSTASDDPTNPSRLTFATQSSSPVVSNEYWIIEPGSWWRPQFRLSLTLVQGRKGSYWTHNAQFRPWCPTTWYSGYRLFGAINTHDPATDDYLSYGIHPLTTTVMLSESPVEPCVEVAVPVFDVPDAGTPQIDYCGDEDHLFNPWVYWSIRGTQLAIEGLVPKFVKPINYTGRKDIHIFDNAEWWAFHSSRNVRITTVASYSGGFLVSLVDHTMPEQTPQAGAWGSLECTYRVVDGDDKTLATGTGTATANSLILDEAWGPGGQAYVGQAIIVSYGWTRRYPRRVKYIYRRDWWEPDEDDDGNLVVPPDADHTGSYQNILPSTRYAEYDQTGNLTENGAEFVNGESARYVAQNRDDGTGSDIPDQPLGNWTDASYMGLPNAGTGYPRWQDGKRHGVVTAGGSSWLEDGKQLWWIGASPLIVHNGTAGGGGGSRTLVDSTKSTDKFWTVSMGGQRFVGHILEVRVHDGDGTPQDPPRWESRPITAHSGTTLTVTVAFSVSTNGKTYRIREPGTDSGHGAILNLWQGRQLRVVKQDGREEFAWITHSDDHRLYFEQNAFSFDPEAGDLYEIIQIEAGAVLQRRNTPRAVSGWSLPEDAKPDDRGEDWHTGPLGPYQNLPTVVKGFGRCRKFDYIGLWNFLDFYRGINALIHVPHGYGWTNKGETNIFGFGFATSPSWTWPDSLPGGIYGSYAEAWSHLLQDTQDQFDFSGPNFTGAGDNAPPNANFSSHANDYSSTVGQPPGSVGTVQDLDVTRQYAYPKITGVTTLMNSDVDFYGYGIIDATDPDDGQAAPWPNHQQTHFNADGAPLLFRKWSRMSSAGVSNLDTRTGSRVGKPNDELPDWTQPQNPLPHSDTGPPNHYASSSMLEGFAVKEDYKAIIRWDVSGGFLYTGGSEAMTADQEFFWWWNQ